MKFRGPVPPPVAGKAPWRWCGREDPRRPGGAAQARRYRGLGFASFIELTNPLASPSVRHRRRQDLAQDGCHRPHGSRRLRRRHVRRHRTGQGTEAILAQIVAHGVGVPVSKVRIVTGDTAPSPMAGGTGPAAAPAHRRRAALQSAIALKEQILEVAGAMLQAQGRASTFVMGRDRRQGDGTGAHAALRARRIVTTVATRCRRSCRASSSRRGTHHQGVPLAFTKRHPGELAGGRRGDRHG